MNMKTYGISQITGERMINDAKATGYQQRKKLDP